ncbi:neuraminidase-like domain-containing protein [Aquimarina sp. 2201CG1-2-11]|uniref:Tc toxin subunit A-related protein n=1 Tax=Aquimarina discodermiae TaxID=3231043 RepID=UPI003462E633
METQKTYLVKGTITNKTNKPLQGLMVRATDVDISTPENLLGSPVFTDAKGRYEIKYAEQDFRKTSKEKGGADIVIRVFLPDGKLLGKSKKHNDTTKHATIDLQLDYTPDKLLEKKYTVSGKVKLPNGSPAKQFMIQVFEKKLRSEKLLTEGLTNTKGSYKLQYTSSDKIRPEKETTDIFIKVYDPKNNFIGVSEVYYNSGTNARIDFDIETKDQVSMSTFELITFQIESLLAGESILKLEQDKKQKDIHFLSGETGHEEQILLQFVQAHHFQNESTIAASFWFVVLGMPFYEKQPYTNLESHRQYLVERLPQLTETGIRKSLDRAFETRKIAKTTKKTIDQWLTKFNEYVAKAQLSTPRAEKSFTKRVLNASGIKDQKKQTTFVKLFNEHKTFSPKLVDQLKKNKSFKVAEIKDLQASFELGNYVNGDFTLVKAIKDTYTIKTSEDIRGLAKHSEKDWETLIVKTAKKETVQIPYDLTLPENETEVFTAAYGKMVHKQLQKSYPTVSFLGSLERSLNTDMGDTNMGIAYASKIKKVLTKNPDFEFLTTPIDELVKKEPVLKKDEALTTEFKAIQRVFKLSPSFEASATLMKDKVHSGYSIYKMGKTEFVRRYENQPGFDRESARATWSRAEATHAATVTLLAELKSTENAGAVAALSAGSEGISDFPNWNNLFKGGDTCECEHCRSVYSPAAYFADILMFLKERRSNGIPVKDILFDRRPDLGYLELNCENANVTLPYIDVVCEVLENVVANGNNDLELNGLTSIDATDLDQAKNDIITAFQNEDIELVTPIHLSQLDGVDKWIVHTESITYLLKKKTTANYFAEILRNTKASADELKANPQYVNPEAYKVLREAKHPFGLPFDLYGEEVKASFAKVKVKRWELMQLFKGTAAPNNASDGDIAVVYFGISSDPSASADEKNIMLQAAPTQQFEFWGANNNTALLNKIKNVKTFLNVTQLKYNELLTLLDLEFINPDKTIHIEHLQPNCDTDQKVITPLSTSILDRMHRFIRLWKKLNWEMWEVDLVINHPSIGAGSINEPFLINLMYFSELKKKLGKKISIEQTCSLLGNINTTTKFTELHKPRKNSLYHDLFLNKKLIHPLNPSFEVDQVDVATNTEKIATHKELIQAALRVKETDLDVFLNLTKASDGTLYIPNGVDGDIILDHLSFLYRHSLLSKTLKIKADDWALLLKVYDQNIALFTDPKTACEFVDLVTTLKASDFSFDEINYVLSAAIDAKSAVTEESIAKFLMTLRTSLQEISSQYDVSQYPFVIEIPPTDTTELIVLATQLLQTLGKSDERLNYILNVLENITVTETNVTGMPAAFSFPNVIADVIKIGYNETSGILRFTGVMTDAERNTLLNDASLAAVTGIVSYQEAIEELYQQPRLALKFYEEKFEAPLSNLPDAIDFKNQLPEETVSKISFNVQEKRIEFLGIMTKVEKDALDVLSTDADYLNAINSIYTQPVSGVFDASKLWIASTDLDYSVANFFEIHLALAIQRLLGYLVEKDSEATIVSQLSAALTLTESVVEKLIKEYQIIGAETIFTHFKDTFGSSSGVVDYATSKDTFDTYHWLSRVGMLINKWNLGFEDVTWLTTYHTPTQAIDFGQLPVDATDSIALLDELIHTEKLFIFNARFKHDELSVLTLLGKLHDGEYVDNTAFSLEVEELTEWKATEVEAWINHTDLNYPTDYLLITNWERIYTSMRILDQLNASVLTALAFTNATQNESESTTLKQVLRSKYGPETWLTISTEIQDEIRKQKRDALSAYLLAQPKPADAPSGKWENTNDLYAYYLLDTEMNSCMLTSRLVQASGSVQLFVQRSFMGLEPKVIVKTDGDDGDSAWKWWKWMRKYRVWEANRKVFLYPENWIEPELRKDKSSFFQDLENELLQNEITQLTAEKAYLNYLDKLNDVARLDIAGFYHEDDADQTFIHVFGRTANADPHIYYYRKYDYRFWTPWEKIEVDIQGDHLIPMVVNKRLYLYWPEFREVPDEDANSTAPIPDADDSSANIQKTKKRTQLRLAGTEYRNNIWMPKKISKDYYESYPSSDPFDRKSLAFYPIDRSDFDGRVGIRFEGGLYGAFELFGCEGVPVKSSIPGFFAHAVYPDQSLVEEQDHNEDPSRTDNPRDFSLIQNMFTNDGSNDYEVLQKTPGLFNSHFAWHFSYLDKFLLGLDNILPDLSDGIRIPLGAWLPFFYADRNKTFAAFPMLNLGRGDDTIAALLGAEGKTKFYYPDIKESFREYEGAAEGTLRTMADAMDLSVYTQAQKVAAANFLNQYLNEEPVTSITDEELRDLMVRFYMQIFRIYLGNASLSLFNERKYHFKNFYHPFVCDFIKKVYNPNKGIPAMLSRETQLMESPFSFAKIYSPTNKVFDFNQGDFYPKEEVDFSADGSYSPYNWELFYHTPLHIANSLSKNQRFEEAMEWYHYIFNPIGVEGTLPDGTDAPAPQKYWITKPFFLTSDETYTKQRIDTILKVLAGDDPDDDDYRNELIGQVKDWRYNPFEPHRIAQYRNVAYQKTVFMKYLDNLIAWGDYLFRQDSMESINEATQLYVLAAELLGPKPKNIPPQVKPPVETFNELENDFDDFSNALIEVENYIPVLPVGDEDTSSLPPIPTLYFCIPKNDKLLGYWDVVVDRLFKIRNCMNIEGVVRQLSLFEPEINPGALVKAVAGGMDIAGAIADLNAPLPYYRFQTLLQKANEVCNDVKSLGSALLSALEKKDAEELVLLRQQHEYKLLDAIRTVREVQIEEAKTNLDALKESKVLTEIKRDYYGGKDFMNAGEIAATVLNGLSIVSHTIGTIADVLAGVMFIIPNFKVGASGFGGSPHFTAETGGESAGNAAERGANGLYNVATILDKSASMASTIASYQRREEEWDFQKDLADQELIQIEEQIKVSELRITVAEKELDNQKLQIKHSEEVDDYMKSKYTNKELYQWMVGEVSQVYFKSYKQAYDLAKKAERCYRFELGVQDSDFIKFGYWDSLKKGLLSGDRLQYDLRKLESVYMDQNKRELELTKHISLRLLDPLALVKLRETGKCFFTLPEELFDLDFPGHYFRRIKSVSISIPCVAGPYTTISASLRILKNHIRTKTEVLDGYAHNSEDGVWVSDSRFIQNNIPIKSIATSNAQGDSGLFQLNFNDERYLPFEGAGVISDWTIDLFNDTNDPDFGKSLRQFDFSTITDAVISVQYTAREAGGILKEGAIANLKEYFGQDDETPSFKIIDLKREFASDWHKLLYPNEGDPNQMTIRITKDLFPYRDNMHSLKINAIALMARCKETGDYDIRLSPPLPTPPPAGADEMILTQVAEYGDLHYGMKDTTVDNITLDFSGDILWDVTIESPTGNALAENEIEDFYVVLGYEWE